MNNNELEKNTFTVIDNNGREITCNVLFTFDSDETKKSYIVYTDNSQDDAGNTQVFASIFDPSQAEGDGKLDLTPIETDKEWKIIETILNTLQDEIKNKGINNNQSNADNNSSEQ